MPVITQAHTVQVEKRIIRSIVTLCIRHYDDDTKRPKDTSDTGAQNNVCNM